MIVRIVKMTFIPEKVGDFLRLFESSKQKIRNFEGCLYLALLNKVDEPNVFFTHSKWISEEHLNRYRSSELFTSTWAKTKLLFKEKPEAWSTKEVVVI